MTTATTETDGQRRKRMSLSVLARIHDTYTAYGMDDHAATMQRKIERVASADASRFAVEGNQS